MKPVYALAAVAAFAAPSFAAARDIDQIQNLSQNDFRSFSEDLGAALSYKPITPTTPLGVTGFDLGIAATSTGLEHRELFDSASGGDFGSRLNVPQLRLNKGLPAGFDVGVMVGAGAGTNIRLWGYEARYAFLKGDTAWPAIGARFSHTEVQGVNQLDLETNGLDFSISKGFLMFTPYLGV